MPRQTRNDDTQSQNENNALVLFKKQRVVVININISDRFDFALQTQQEHTILFQTTTWKMKANDQTTDENKVKIHNKLFIIIIYMKGNYRMIKLKKTEQLTSTTYIILITVQASQKTDNIFW